MRTLDDRIRRIAPPWFSIERARRSQRILASLVKEVDELPERIRTVGGADIAYKGDIAYGVAVLLDFPSLVVKKYAVSSIKVKFPYIPTLLAFREAGPIIDAVKKLGQFPDILFVDGQGRAHPYRLGLACHVGVVLDIPTIGIAKKKLCGKIGPFKNGWAPIIDNGEVVGAALITKEGCNPIYVSVGHKVSLETAIKLTLKCIRGHKLPEPVRLAHNIATRIRRSGL
ncbi:MAG: endonuclease V [Thermoprotei archaeon]|nr:MAG: endonuclease V [Thermoprotei archaeon]